jgi:hypothetical protein
VPVPPGSATLLVISDAMVLGKRGWERRRFAKSCVLSFRQRFNMPGNPR